MPGISWSCRQKGSAFYLLATRSGTVENIPEGFLRITRTFGGPEQEKAGVKDAVFVFSAVLRSKQYLILCALTNAIRDVQRLFGSRNARPGCRKHVEGLGNPVAAGSVSFSTHK